ncbi:MAG: hypothetical protein WKF67_07840 [Rubrobacteraceae bacterium]
MSKSDILENILLDEVLGGVNYAPAANVSIALYTTTPTDAAAGTEVTGGAYARVVKANNATNWPAAAAGSKTNGTAINFPTASATWGTVTGFGIFDDQATPRLLYWGALAQSREILSGDTPSFAANSLSIQED